MTIIEPKRQNPITIRLDEKYAYVVVDDGTVNPISLEEKTTISSENYGITIYTADGARQYYGTQSKIESVEIKDKYLVIYEEGKSIPWKIDKSGIAVNRSRFDENKEEDIKFVKEKYGLTKGDIPSLNDYEAYIEYVMEIEPKIEHPIGIYLNDEKYNHKDSFDENGKFIIPLSSLNPTIFVGIESPYFSLREGEGVMLDSNCNQYGFRVISSRKSKSFPTQCRILGAQLTRDNLITVYEEGKTIPWKINGDLEVEQYAMFVSISRSDIKYLEENFGLSKDDIENVNSYGLKYDNKEN